jgi:hypothetical protein
MAQPLQMILNFFQFVQGTLIKLFNDGLADKLILYALKVGSAVVPTFLPA